MDNKVNDRQHNEAEAIRWLTSQLRWENRLRVLREGGTVDAAVEQEPALAA